LAFDKRVNIRAACLAELTYLLIYSVCLYAGIIKQRCYFAFNA
jgi:hypothetical protein